jgi:hypothetical protein
MWHVDLTKVDFGIGFHQEFEPEWIEGQLEQMTLREHSPSE